jgi:hypothetical protein
MHSEAIVNRKSDERLAKLEFVVVGLPSQAHFGGTLDGAVNGLPSYKAAQPN